MLGSAVPKLPLPVVLSHELQHLGYHVRTAQRTPSRDLAASPVLVHHHQLWDAPLALNVGTPFCTVYALQWLQLLEALCQYFVFSASKAGGLTPPTVLLLFAAFRLFFAQAITTVLPVPLAHYVMTGTRRMLLSLDILCYRFLQISIIVGCF